MTTTEFQHFRLSMLGDVALVEILTRDLQGYKTGLELGFELARVLDLDRARRILLDFRRAAFLSSSSFAALFRLVSHARASGREVRFCSMAPDVLAGAEVVGLPKVVPIHQDQTAGLRAFMGPVDIADSATTLPGP
jgi:anti-anti-sigma factor